MLLSTKANKLHSRLTPVSITEREALSQRKVLGASATTEICSFTACNAASELVSSKYSMCGVWECGPSLCGAAWHKATSRSQ